MLEDRIVDALKQLGLTATEGRAYLALLQSHPATGYELSARSKVPRSAIYDVLHRLQALGIINAIQAKPQKFVPLPPEALMKLLESRFARSLDALRDSLEDFKGQVEEAPTWTLRGYESMLEQARAIIEEARDTLYASMWGREAFALERSLKAARDRGVGLVVFSFNEVPTEIERVFSYGISERALEAYWSHKIILIGDRKRLLAGGADTAESNRAVVTEEPSLIEMAVSNLILDITLYGQRMNQDVGPVVQSLTEPFAPVERLIPDLS